MTNETNQTISTNATIATNATTNTSDSSNATSANAPARPPPKKPFKGSNSIGKPLQDGQVRKPPFKIKRCDQVVLINGTRFESYTDFTKKEQTFYVIGIYVVNIFESKDTESLIDSIELTNMNEIPQFIPGSGTCLDIFNKVSNKRFPICLESKKIMLEIQQVFRDFIRCRNGDNLGDYYEKALACKKENQKPKKTMFGDQTDPIMKKINPYYDNKPPGS